MAELSKREKKKAEKQARKERIARQKVEVKEAKIARKEEEKAFKASLKQMSRKDRKEAKKKHKLELKNDQTFVNVGATYSPRQIVAELRRVKWPTFKELMSTSGLVIIFTVLFGVYFFLCELLANGLIQKLIEL